jgi:hypothetical protein
MEKRVCTRTLAGHIGVWGVRGMRWHLPVCQVAYFIAYVIRVSAEYYGQVLVRSIYVYAVLKKHYTDHPEGVWVHEKERATNPQSLQPPHAYSKYYFSHVLSEMGPGGYAHGLWIQTLLYLLLHWGRRGCCCCWHGHVCVCVCTSDTTL